MNPPKTKGIVTFYSQDNTYNDPLASVSAHFFSLMTHMYLSQTGIPDRIPPNLLLKIPYKNAIFHIHAKKSKNIQIVH